MVVIMIVIAIVGVTVMNSGSHTDSNSHSDRRSQRQTKSVISQRQRHRQRARLDTRQARLRPPAWPDASNSLASIILSISTVDLNSWLLLSDSTFDNCRRENLAPRRHTKPHIRSSLSQVLSCRRPCLRAFTCVSPTQLRLSLSRSCPPCSLSS